MFYLIHNVLIIFIIFNVCILLIETSPSATVWSTTTPTVSTIGTIIGSSSEENINNGSTYIRRLSPNNNATVNSPRDRNSQLFSVLAAKRRQILQNRLHSHLTTITADIVETTTHLNQILGRNLTRVYVDIRAIRNPQLRRTSSFASTNNTNKETLKVSTTDTKNGGNITTDLNNSQTNRNRTLNGTVPSFNNNSNATNNVTRTQNGSPSLNITGSSLNATDSSSNTNPFSFNINHPLSKNGTTKENVSQLAQNSSKLFQNTLFLLGNSDGSKTNLSANRKSVNRHFRNSLYNQQQQQQTVPKSVYKINKNADIKTILKEATNISKRLENDTIENNIDNRQNSYIPLQTSGKRLPIDLEQIAIDTLGIAENKRLQDDLIVDNEDSLQVEESNHGLFLLNFLKNATRAENSIENITELLNSSKDILKNKVQNITTKSPKTDSNDKQTPNNEKLNQNSTNKTLFMSESIYNHFRPLESNLPEDEIQPFLYFGQKIVSSTTKPNLNRNVNKLYTQRHHSRFNPDSLVNLRRNANNNDNSESSLMDLSVERSNIANKVLNIRNLVPSRHPNPVINYFRSVNNNTNSAYNTTRSPTSYKAPNNKTEPSNILGTQRRNNMDAKNISIKYDTVNMSNTSAESSEVAHPRETFLKRQRQYYTRNPNNRTFIKMSKRNGVSPVNITAKIIPNSNAKPLALSLNESVPPKTQTTTEKIISVTGRSENFTMEPTTAVPVLTTEVVSTNVVTSVSIKGVDKQNTTTVTTTTTTTTASVDDKSSENINTNKIIEPTTRKFRIIVEDIPPETTTQKSVEKSPITEKVIRTTSVRHTIETSPSTQRTAQTTFVLKPKPTTTTRSTTTVQYTQKTTETSTTTTSTPASSTRSTDDPNEMFTSKVEIITLNSKTPKPIHITTEQTSKHNIADFETSIYTRPLETSTQTNENRNKSKSTANVPTRPNKSSSDVPETIILRQNDNQLEDNNLAAYIFAILGLLPLTIIIGFIVRNLLHWRLKAFDSEADILAENGPDKSEKHSGISPVSRLSMVITDTNSKWEFPRNKLRLKTLLGEGNFGQVWKAEADDLKDHDGLTRLVAVKTIKDGAGPKEREDLHRELFIMQKIGSHPNVVQLLGCCTDKEPYLLIMEYVMYGKLLTYLRDHRARRDYYNFSDDSATLTSRDLTVFAYCVARGMEYLSSKGIIHRDLAARNILVDHNKLCKISDFGLSRYSPTKEVKEPRQPKNALPVRWMATEALMFSLFTEKSDVWSFGILLWEIVTLGATPYANMSGREVMHCVCEGYRLERPSHCKPELYRVMARTWASDPNQRPTFAELRQELAELLENNSMDYSYVDLESFAADSNIYEITNMNSRGNYCTIQSRISEFECDI